MNRDFNRNLGGPSSGRSRKVLAHVLKPFASRISK